CRLGSTSPGRPGWPMVATSRPDCARRPAIAGTDSARTEPSRVQLARLDQYGADRLRRAAADRREEAASPAGMAGHTGLIDQQQQAIAVAIDPQLDQRLHLSG